MNLETLTKEQAQMVVSWARTDAGKLFNDYLSEQSDPAFADLTSAANMRDVFRAQGSLQMIERVLNFFVHCTKVANEDYESEGLVAPDQSVYDLPAPWGAPVDDGTGMGGET